MCIFKQKKCEMKPSVISLHPNEYSKELHYYPFGHLGSN